MTELQDRLCDVIGLEARSVGVRALERSIRDGMARLNLGAEDYLQRVRRDPAELDRLVEGVVVPETWFFREREAFELIVEHARQSLRDRPRPYRILSAACSVGAEPYSALIVMLEAGVPIDRVEIEGHDVSERNLEAARRAVYGAYAFRGCDPQQVARHFTETDEGRSLRPALRQRVRFQRSNLLDPAYLAGRSYDAILCRNVFIYFTPQARTSVVGNLVRRLEAYGILLLGRAESLDPTLSGAKRLRGKGWAYQRGFERVPTAPRPVPRPRPPVRPAPAAVEPAPAAPPRVPRPEELLREASSLADRGQTDQAMARCRQVLEQVGATSEAAVEAYHLLGLLSLGLSDDRAAESYLEKVVYLAPRHRDALVQLALLAQRRGDHDRAAQFRRRATGATS